MTDSKPHSEMSISPFRGVMREAYLKKLDAIEELIKHAHWGTAQKKLLGLRKKKIPTEFVLRFARLARRANLPELALSTLRTSVRSEGSERVFASEDHKIEYAANLVRLGACREAERLFESIDLDKNVEALLFKASLYVKEWNYPLAIPLYRQYIQRCEPESYQYFLGKVNLAMCLIFEGQYREAAADINEVLVNKNASKWTLLKGNAYRILGGLEVHRGNYQDALTALFHAKSVFKDPNGIDRFLINKWIVLTNYFLSGGDEAIRKTVHAVRLEAIQREHWESVRDIDYQLACFENDEKTLVKLYFGTPFERFKKRLQSRFPQLRIPLGFSLQLGEGKGKPLRFNLKEHQIKPGQSTFRLLQALLSDYYRSFSLIELFEKTFPGESYIPRSSEERIYQAMKRLRRELDTCKIPLAIETHSTGFRLKGRKPIEILCSIETPVPISQSEHRLEELKQSFLHTSFDAPTAAKTLRLSRRTVNSLIQLALENGSLKKEGAGNRIKYTFITPGDALFKKAG